MYHASVNGTNTTVPPGHTLSPHAISFGPRCSTVGPAVTTITMASRPVDAMLLALLAQQIPPLPKFNGDTLEGKGESFADWIEQLELIAETGQWSEQAKLVNLVTRLRGQAYIMCAESTCQLQHPSCCP